MTAVRQWSEALFTRALTVAAVAMAATVVWREFVPKPSVTMDAGLPELITDWEDVRAAARPLGDKNAAVQFFEFADLECPACRQLHSTTVAALRAKYTPSQLTVNYIHFPLRNHRFALIASHASECAAQQERFQQFVEVVFSKQDSIGLKPWLGLAAEAGVIDSTEFARCLTSATVPPLVEAGLKVGARIGVNATPTVMINGWRFRHAPSLTEAVRVVDELLAGRNPFP